MPWQGWLPTSTARRRRRRQADEARVALCCKLIMLGARRSGGLRRRLPDADLRARLARAEAKRDAGCADERRAAIDAHEILPIDFSEVQARAAARTGQLYWGCAGKPIGCAGRAPGVAPAHSCEPARTLLRAPGPGPAASRFGRSTLNRVSAWYFAGGGRSAPRLNLSFGRVQPQLRCQEHACRPDMPKHALVSSQRTKR